jgi:hypothetical protein
VSVREPARLADLLAVRLLRGSIRFGFFVSVIAFFVLGSTVLIDQWIAGQVSAIFLVGTALLLAGFCTGLFAAVAAVGLVLSMFFNDHSARTENQMPIPQERSDDEVSPNDAGRLVEM